MKSLFPSLLTLLISASGLIAQKRAADSIPFELENTTKLEYDKVLEDEIIRKIQEGNVSIPLNREADTIPFDFNNTMKLEYNVEEDEILKKIEAGDPSIPLSNKRDSAEKCTLCLMPRVFFPKKETRAKGTDSTGTITGIKTLVTRDAEGRMIPLIPNPFIIVGNSANCAQMVTPIRDAVIPVIIEIKQPNKKRNSDYSLPDDTLSGVPKPNKNFGVINGYPNETAIVIPGYNKKTEMQTPSITTKAIPHILIDANEEKIKVLLQSLVDEEFLIGKKYDSTGFLKKYSTYGCGLRCPLFTKSCFDVYTDSVGQTIWRIHDTKEVTGWNCTGNYVFGCDTDCIKTESGAVSASFQHKRTSYVKNGKTVLFHLLRSTGEKTTETWEILQQNKDEIMLKKTAEGL